MSREEALKQLGLDIVEQMKDQAEQIGAELAADLEDVAIYASERADHLSLAVGEPGFQQALVAERDNLALKAATATVERADALDDRILAVAQGGLALAARGLRILAGVPPVA